MKTATVRTLGSTLALGGAAVVLAGTLLPWERVSIDSGEAVGRHGFEVASGLRADLAIAFILVLTVGAVVPSTSRTPSLGRQLWSLACGACLVAAALLLVLACASDVTWVPVAVGAAGHGRIGAGLVLVVAGALGTFSGTLLGLLGASSSDRAME